MQISPTAITFIVIIALEVGIIIVGNVFTIFVFWTQRSHLKRTYLLLINLAVADLLAAIGETLVLATHTIPSGGNEAAKTHSPSWALEVFGSSTSVFFLALISLECVYAMLWPLRHRVTSTQAYIYSIVVVWVAGLCMAALSLLTIYQVVDIVYATVTYATFLLISLLVICVSYLTIRSRLHCKAPVLDVHRQTSTEKNLRMSRTLFIVIAVSLVVWLPAFVILTIKDFCSCFSSLAVSFVTVLHLSNSMVNPFVYSFRMPMFQDAMKKFWRKRRQNIELRAVASNVQSHNL
ncbi:sphingosine 1-phosphate receptor 1-like [Oculina patagonica]